MEFILRQGGAADALFTVETAAGEYCRVCGEQGALHSRLWLLPPQGAALAKIVRVGTPELSRCGVLTGGRERAVLFTSVAGRRQAWFSRPPWRFRGDLKSRAFDVVDVDGALRMTHSPFWAARGVCYAVTVPREEDAALCLAAAAAIDLASPGRAPGAVPAAPG